jgi:hypothetical protein
MNAELSNASMSDEKESTLSELRGLALSLSHELEGRRKRTRPVCHLLCEIGRFLSLQFSIVPPVRLDFRALDQAVYELLNALDDCDLVHAEIAVSNMLNRAGLA